MFTLSWASHSQWCNNPLAFPCSTHNHSLHMWQNTQLFQSFQQPKESWERSCCFSWVRHAREPRSSSACTCHCLHDCQILVWKSESESYLWFFTVLVKDMTTVQPATMSFLSVLGQIVSSREIVSGCTSNCACENEDVGELHCEILEEMRWASARRFGNRKRRTWWWSSLYQGDEEVYLYASFLKAIASPEECVRLYRNSAEWRSCPFYLVLYHVETRMSTLHYKFAIQLSLLHHIAGSLTVYSWPYLVGILPHKFLLETLLP